MKNLTFLLIKFSERILALLLLLNIVGCTTSHSVIKMDAQRLTMLSKESMRLLHYEPEAPLQVISARTAAPSKIFGLLGASASQRQYAETGMAMMKEYSISDPVVIVRERFVRLLRDNAGFTNLPLVSEQSSAIDGSIKSLKATYEKGYVIDFKTNYWKLQYYYPIDYDHFYTGLSIRARIVSLSEEGVVWQGVCEIEEHQDSKSRPTLEELTAENGSLLKRKFFDNAEKCVEELRLQFLNHK